MHSPDQQAASAARRLGGLRRRRETAVSGAFVFNGQGTVADIRRLVEIAAVDALELENSNQRSRTLAVLAHAALKLLEVGELQTRVEALERASTVPARRAG
jgi:hypothetical protein